MTHTAEDGSRFLRNLLGEGETHHLVAIVPDGHGPGKVQNRSYKPDAGEAEASWIHNQNEARNANVYFHANRLRGEPKNRKATKAEVSALRLWAVDIDLPADCSDPPKWRQEKEKELQESPCPPTAIICSGNGLQAFWKAAHPVPLDSEADGQAQEAINAALAQAFGGDVTHNIDRVFRVPGTQNIPNAIKRSKGLETTPAFVMEWPNGRQYDPDDFAPLMPAHRPPSAPTATESGTADPAELLQRLPGWLQERLRSSPAKGTRSEAICATIRGLFEHQLSVNEVETLLAAYPSGVAEKHVQRGDLQAEISRNWRKWQDGTRVDKATAPQLLSRRASDIPPKPLEWLWPGRFPLNKPSLIGGHPGLAKSQIATYAAANTTTGRSWPDGSPCEYPGDVAILSAEDDAEDTLVPRLIAAEADLERVHIIHGAPGAQGVERAINLQKDLDKLENTVARLGVRLVIIDPISAYLGATDSHKDAEVRGLLAPLSTIAARHRAAILAVTHFNKGGGSDAIMRFMGSVAVVAAMRAVWAVVLDPYSEQPGRRLLLPVKSNLGPDLGGLAYTVEPVVLDNGIETSRVQWQDGAVHISADHALAAPTRDRGSGDALGTAKEFLRDTLAAGPVPCAEIRQAAEAENLGSRTVQQAKKDLGIVSKKQGHAWIWTFPDDS